MLDILFSRPIYTQTKTNSTSAIPKGKNLSSKTFNNYNKKNINTYFYTPFKEIDRDKYQSVKNRMISWYGEFRTSYKRGHKHAGVDLKGKYNELVYPIGNGQVIKVFKSFPNKSIVIKHSLSDGKNIYSIYTHVEDIKVKIDDWIDEKTVLARLFNEEELKKSNFGTLNHLHLEIRKSFKDGGRASYASMTLDALNKYCLDPMTFFQKHLK